MSSLIDELEQLWIDHPKEVIERVEAAMQSASADLVPRLCSVCGAAYRRLARLDEAYSVLLIGMALAQERKDFGAEAKLLQRIACVFGDQGDYLRAVATSERAALKFLQTGNLGGSGQAVFDMGMWHYYLEDFEASLRLCRSAYRILPSVEVNHRFAALQCLALASMEVGDLPRARRYADFASRFQGQIGGSMWAKLLWLRAKLYSQMGDFRQAETTLEHALRFFLDTEAYLDVALACAEITQIVLKSGDAGRAREVASSFGKLVVSNPQLGDNKLAAAAIMEMVRCGITGGNLEVTLQRIKRRLERAETRPRPLS